LAPFSLIFSAQMVAHGHSKPLFGWFHSNSSHSIKEFTQAKLILKNIVFLYFWQHYKYLLHFSFSTDYRWFLLVLLLAGIWQKFA
jgi:hypothetical protein